MKTSKMLELVENLKVGEKVIIEKFEDHLFIEKKLDNRIPSKWIPAPSDNVNIHGVDLSILNDEDWVYLEIGNRLRKWINRGKIFQPDEKSVSFALESECIYFGDLLCDEEDIRILRKATPEDLAPFFEKYPQYAPVKVGDIGLFYNKKYVELKAIKDGELNLSRVEGINEIKAYPFSTKYSHYKHFFKVHESETISEIKERFLKEVGNDKDK